MERIKELRKNLNLSQDAFGKKLGVTGTAVSRIEKGERSLTEQMALAICREFRVNYYWLTKGQLPMFTGTPESLVDEIAEDYNLDEIDKKIIQKYLELDDEHRQFLKDYLKSIFT
ncbi:MAG: helix-turn-helix transcriptional regulator [Dorea sp.]|nr:helix-turn-helix transcriptional regulator [Dorea sp.]